MTNHLFANTLNKVIFISLPVAYTFFNESINSYSLKNNAAAVLGHPQPWQLGFQTPAAPIAEGIIAFHDDLMVFLTFILFFVIVILSTCLYTFTETKKNGESDPLVHASTLEIVWTLIPAIILIIIAIPSFSLLYSVDEIVEPLLTLKIIGHQWYWSYEFFNAETLSHLLDLEFNTQYESISTFDSYMLSDEDIANNVGLTSYRLYTVDKHVGLPARVPTRLLMTSNDVLHSWTVPSLGVKVDACPGRLNQSSLYIKYSGIFYGQCSEICGTNHAFMPIGIVAFDLGLPLYVLEDVFSDLEPIIVSLQTQGEPVSVRIGHYLGGSVISSLGGVLQTSGVWIYEHPIETTIITVGLVATGYVTWVYIIPYCCGTAAGAAGAAGGGKIASDVATHFTEQQVASKVAEQVAKHTAALSEKAAEQAAEQAAKCTAALAEQAARHAAALAEQAAEQAARHAAALAEQAARHAAALAQQAAEQAAGYGALRGFARIANIDVGRTPTGGLISPVRDSLFKDLFRFNMDVVCDMTAPGILGRITAEQRDYIILNTVRMTYMTAEEVTKLIAGGLV